MQLERIAWSGAGAASEAVLRRALEDEGFTVCACSDPPGRTYAPHRHAHDESLWVVRGSIVFRAGGEQYALGPGDRLMLPRGTLHAATAGSEGVTYLIGERD